MSDCLNTHRRAAQISAPTCIQSAETDSERTGPLARPVRPPASQLPAAKQTTVSSGLMYNVLLAGLPAQLRSELALLRAASLRPLSLRSNWLCGAPSSGRHHHRHRRRHRRRQWSTIFSQGRRRSFHAGHGLGRLARSSPAPCSLVPSARLVGVLVVVSRVLSSTSAGATPPSQPAGEPLDSRPSHRRAYTHADV